MVCWGEDGGVMCWSEEGVVLCAGVKRDGCALLG